MYSYLMDSDTNQCICKTVPSIKPFVLRKLTKIVMLGHARFHTFHNNAMAGQLGLVYIIFKRF